MAYGQRPLNCPPEVDAIEEYGGGWSSDKPFPQTAEEALWVLMGYAVKPASGPLSLEDHSLIPGKCELSNGRLVLWRAQSASGRADRPSECAVEN